MRAVRLHRFGGDPRVDDLAEPGPPGPGEVLVDLLAAGVGTWDRSVREGALSRYVSDDDLPITMGAQLTGRIRTIGAGVESFEIGQRVMANPGLTGAWAERVRLSAESCGRAPDGLSDQEAATLPVRALTAVQALDLLDASPGSTLFVVGGGGAVGRAAIEIASGRGVRVLAIAGGDELAGLRRLGAAAAADYRGEWESELVHDGAPVDLVLDLVGGDSLRRALAVLRDGGRATTTISDESGLQPQRGISLEFLGMKSSTAALDDAAALADEGRLTARVAATYPLAEAAAALDAVRAMDIEGDVALSP